MSKKYRLKKDIPGYNAGLIFECDNEGGIGISEGVSIPDLKYFSLHLSDTDWFEPVEDKVEIWRPEAPDYNHYRIISNSMVIEAQSYVQESYNYYKTEGEAEKAAKREVATRKIIKYIEAVNAGWGAADTLDGFHVTINAVGNICVRGSGDYQPIYMQIRTREKAEEVLEACREEYFIYYGVKDE